MYGSTMLTQIIEEIHPGLEIHCFLNLPWRFSMAAQVKRQQKRLRTADLGHSDWSEHRLAPVRGVQMRVLGRPPARRARRTMFSTSVGD